MADKRDSSLALDHTPGFDMDTSQRILRVYTHLKRYVRKYITEAVRQEFIGIFIQVDRNDRSRPRPDA